MELGWLKAWEKYFPAGGMGISKIIRSGVALILTFVFVTIGWFFFMSSTEKVHNVIAHKIDFLNSDYVSASDGDVLIEEHYFANFGWGILVKYPTSQNVFYDIEMKKIEGEEWEMMEENRNGKYAGFGIHGRIKKGKDERNRSLEHMWFG